MNEQYLRDTLTPVSGSWSEEEDILFSNEPQRTAYRSETEPSFAAWAILWRDREGLKLSFTEVEAAPGFWPPSHNFNSPGLHSHIRTLLSADNGETWQDTGLSEPFDALWQINSDHHIRHVLPLDDGRLLRIYPHTVEGRVSRYDRVAHDPALEAESLYPYAYEQDVPFTNKDSMVWESADGGKTWQVKASFQGVFFTGFHQLNDGSLLLMGAIRGDGGNLYPESFKTWKPAISRSTDGGRTWCAPYTIDAAFPCDMGEEIDFVQCTDGRLLAVFRNFGKSLLQLYLRFNENTARWEADGAVTALPYPPYNYPFLLKASDGTLFMNYFVHSLEYSVDEGRSWRSHPLDGRFYYAQLLETAPGQLLLAAHDDFDDNPYPSFNDIAIQTLRLDFRRVKQWIQDGVRGVAVAGRADGDFHVMVELRTEREAGVIFARQGDRAYFVGIRREPALCICIGAMEGERRELLAARSLALLGDVTADSWMQLQVDRQGGAITAAVRIPGKPAVYVLSRGLDGPGEIGLFAGGAARFREPRLAQRSMDIRSNWGSHAPDRKAVNG